MKTKKFNKKLVLSKRTVANLSSKEMKDAYGGIETRSCPGTCIGCITYTGLEICANC